MFRSGVGVESRGVESLGGRLWSALPADRREAHYDRLAAVYDRVVSGRAYNRWVWGIGRERYGEVIGRALAATGDGVLLDAGAGSALFTAAEYGRRPVRAVLLDRSLGMLRRADARLAAELPVDLVQGDLYGLPFADRAFDVVLHFGIPHVLADWAPVVRELVRVVRPGGTVHVASLVRSGRLLGDGFLRVLQAAGEVAAPRTAAEVEQVLATAGAVTSEQQGNWVFAVVSVPRT
jgi:SAM-dependent methyltransferase